MTGNTCTMPQANHRAIWFITAVLPALSCGAPGRPSVTSPPGDPAPTGYVLRQVEAFDLGIPADFFRQDGRALPGLPAIDSCHIQGVAVTSEDLILSCVLYDEHNDETSTYIGRSLLLRTRLCDVVGCPDRHPPTWQAQDITEPVPASENLRISRLLAGDGPLTPEQQARQHLLTHPSGLTYDARRGGVWVGNSVYAPNSYSHVMLFDPAAIGSGKTARELAKQTIAVSDHASALALVDGRYLISPNWGSESFIIIDLENPQSPITVANPLRDTRDAASLQDCDGWQGSQVICDGNVVYEVDPSVPDQPLDQTRLNDPDRDTIRVRLGRLQVLKFDVSRYPHVAIELTGQIPGVLAGDTEPRIDLGIRRYRYDSDGKQVILEYNDYGGHVLAVPLTYEGMAVDPARQYVYFVPSDLPAGKLIRMRLDRVDRRQGT